MLMMMTMMIEYDFIWLSLVHFYAFLLMYQTVNSKAEFIHR